MYAPRTENRTTTLESLLAIVGLICCESKEDFVRYYKTAMHDDNGAGIWYHMTHTKRGTPRTANEE